MIDHFLSRVTSLIHVGAHAGDERDLYASHDLSVFWVEALPETFADLEKNLVGFPKQKAARALVTDRAGQDVTFHVSSNSGASSSIFDLAMHRDIWPEVTMTRDVQLETSILDDVVLKRAPEFLDAQALVMDTQGSELLVLKGAPRVLEHVRFVKTEAADFESYKGCTTVAEISSFLATRGFRLVEQEEFESHPAGGKYYDVLYARPEPGLLSKIKAALGLAK